MYVCVIRDRFVYVCVYLFVDISPMRRTRITLY